MYIHQKICLSLYGTTFITAPLFIKSIEWIINSNKKEKLLLYTLIWNESHRQTQGWVKESRHKSVSWISITESSRIGKTNLRWKKSEWLPLWRQRVFIDWEGIWVFSCVGNILSFIWGGITWFLHTCTHICMNWHLADM